MAAVRGGWPLTGRCRRRLRRADCRRTWVGGAKLPHRNCGWSPSTHVDQRCSRSVPRPAPSCPCCQVPCGKFLHQLTDEAATVSDPGNSRPPLASPGHVAEREASRRSGHVRNERQRAAAPAHPSGVHHRRGGMHPAVGRRLDDRAGNMAGRHRHELRTAGHQRPGVVTTGALEAELVGADLPPELRQAGVRQLWIVVPFAVVVAAIAHAWSGRRPSMGDRWVKCNGGVGLSQGAR
jgi:hypothetical protein